MGTAVDAELEKGIVGTFKIPKAEQTAFNKYVKGSIQMNGNSFYSVMPLNKDELTDALHNLYFSFKKGDINNVARVEANKQNVRRLKKRVNTSINSQRSPASGKSLGEI